MDMQLAENRKTCATSDRVLRLSAQHVLACILFIAWTLTDARNAVAFQLGESPGPTIQAGSNKHLPAPDGSAAKYPDDVPRIQDIEINIRGARYLEVEPILRQYLADHPLSWRAHYDLGYVLFRMRGGTLPLADAIKESIKELSRSLELNINNADAHKILALDLTMFQREDLAEVELNQAVRLNPGSAEIHYFLGRHYMGQSNYGLARTELETAIQLDPTYMKAYDNLGITLDLLGDRTAALKNYLKAIELDERQGLPSELPYLDLAKSYHEQNDLAGAASFATKAISKNPRSDLAYFELARIYFDNAQWSEAVEALQKAIAIDQYSMQYYYLLGRTYRNLGKLDESKRAFENYSKYRALSGNLGPQSQTKENP
jgi:tetratricopeptide (TPR) repeat protein